MSLATTCPQCKTSFKVVPDQLKLRRGLVRCGICRHVFSGVDFLKYLEDTARPGASAAAAPPTAPEQQPRSTPAPEQRSTPPGEGEPPERDASPTLLEAAPRTASVPDAEPDVVRPPAKHEGVDLEGLKWPAREPVDRSPDHLPAQGEPIASKSAERESVDGESIGREPLDREHFLDEPAARAPVDHRLGVLEAADQARADHELGDFNFVDREPDEPKSLYADPEPTGSKVDGPAIDDDIFGDTRYDLPPPDAITATGHVVTAGASAPAESEEIGSPDDDAVDFFSTNERTGGFATRATVFAAMAAFVLGIALVFQLTIGARDWLAAALPVLRPALVAASAPLGLSVQPPRQLGALTIESFELQSAGESGLLSMSALLRNGVDHPVRWPAMELSLTDGSGAVVVRKVLLPADYLAGASRAETDGVAANAEWPLRVALEPQGVEPTAYSVKLFYP